jgi:DNA-binding IclR family transcriptional regulator
MAIVTIPGLGHGLMSLREIAEALGVPKSMVGDWCK